MNDGKTDSRYLPLIAPQVFVFVSSTWMDLQKERRAVEMAVQQLRATKFIGMEYFGSRHENTRRASLEEVIRSHVYLGIFAGRYGSGITEEEYHEAFKRGLPCYLYFKDEAAIEDKWREAAPDKARRLETLKEELRGLHTIAVFITPDELALKVTADISNWLFDHYLPVQLEAAVNGELPRDKAKVLLSAIRDLRSLNQALLTQLRDAGYVTDLDDKLLDYVGKLKEDPEFADWNQQHYFELRLGNERKDFDVRARLKSPIEDEGGDLKDKYTVGEAIKDFRRLVIVGEPGSGKTTALKRLALTFAEQFGETVGLGAQAAPDPLPVYIWLPRFNWVSGATPYERVVALIRDAFQAREVLLDSDDIKLLLESFQMALLLDGLNEIGDNSINLFLEGLNTFTSNHEQHLVVITSRTYNFQFGRYTAPVLELLELSYPDGINEYLRCYLGHAIDVRSLMKILESNLQMRQLAINPLLLLMIILVFKNSHGRVPNSRGVLFRTIARGMLGEWTMPKAESSQIHPSRTKPARDYLSRPRSEPRQVYWSEDKHRLLSYLGYAMKEEGLELKTKRATTIFGEMLSKQPDWFSPRNTDRPTILLPARRLTGRIS